MLFLEELDDLRLYSSRRKMYIPIDPANRKKGAAIMLLSKNSVDSHTMMNLPYIHNPKLYESLYIDRNVNALIDTGAIIDEKDEELAVNEAMQHDIEKRSDEIKVSIDCKTSSVNDAKILKSVYNEKTFKKWYKFFKTSERYISRDIKIEAYPSLKDAVGDHQAKAMEQRDVISRSYSYNDTIVVVAKSGYKALESREGEYEKYLLNELITFVAMKTSKHCNRYLANHIGTALSGQLDDKLYDKITDNYGNIDDYEMATSYMVKKMYDEQGRNAIIKLCHSGDYSMLSRYASRSIIKNISTMFGESTNDVFNESTLHEYAYPVNLYYDLMEVFNTFSDEEKHRIAIGGDYSDSPNAIHRSIKRDDSGNPIGFIDAYKFDNRPYEAQLVVGMHPDHRGKGHMRNMLGDYINHPIDGHPGITRFVWFTDPMNDKSVKLATSCGFKKNGKRRYREDLGIYEDMYEYEIPFHHESTRIPLPTNIIKESVQSDGYSMTDDYIMTENFITFFNGMDCQAITEAEKKYDSKLKQYLFKERLKNNKAVLMRYEEMKVMNPWIKRTFLKLAQYQRHNLFIDMSFYHALFLKNLKFNKDAAIKMYWDFINRLLNDSEYKTLYPKMTIFIPVWPDAWEVKNAEELMDYKQSINPISLIIRMLRKNPNDLKKWGNKDILFVSPNGYFKLNFTKFELKDLAKFRRFITKLTNNESIDDDETEDGYTTSKEVDSTAVITANVVDKIEKGTGIKIDDLSGGTENPGKPEELADVFKPSLNFTHLRVRAEGIKLPKEDYANKDNNTKNAVLILAPDGDSAADGFIDNPFDKTLFNKRGFYSP